MYKDFKSEIDAGYAAMLEAWNVENRDGPKDGQKKPSRFAYQNTFLREKYDAESEEMKARVEEYRAKTLDVAPNEVNRQYQL